MRRTGTALLIALACLVQGAIAQVVLPDKESQSPLPSQVFGVGLSGGPVSGIGISFRHHLRSAFSYQLTGGIIKVDDRLSYAIGGEAQFDLVHAQSSRFFVAGGAGYYYSGKSDRNDMVAPGRFGVGLGGEVWVGSGVHGSAELLFTYFTDGTVLPLPQVAFHYYFF